MSEHMGELRSLEEDLEALTDYIYDNASSFDIAEKRWAKEFLDNKNYYRILIVDEKSSIMIDLSKVKRFFGKWEVGYFRLDEIVLAVDDNTHVKADYHWSGNRKTWERCFKKAIITFELNLGR